MSPGAAVILADSYSLANPQINRYFYLKALSAQNPVFKEEGRWRAPHLGSNRWEWNPRVRSHELPCGSNSYPPTSTSSPADSHSPSPSSNDLWPLTPNCLRKRELQVFVFLFISWVSCWGIDWPIWTTARVLCVGCTRAPWRFPLPAVYALT